MREPAIIGDRRKVGPDTYIGPSSSIGDHDTMQNTETENIIVMEGTSTEWRSNG